MRRPPNDIEKYLDAMHYPELMKSTLDAMAKQMHQMTHAQLEKQPNLPAGFEARVDKMMDDMIKDFPVDDLMQAMIPAYQKHLTKSEVDALTAFYSAPTGQKILKEMPAMSADAMQAASGVMQKMMANMQDRLQSEHRPGAQRCGRKFQAAPQSTPN